jgi:adenosylmethionine---8-amino-7-oxononanoate aminotransferase
MLPMAATLATARIFDGFRGGRARALMHGHSYTGNPLGAAVAREVLAVYRDERVLEQARLKAPLLSGALGELVGLEGVRATRAIGLVGAVDLGSRGYLSDVGWRVYDQALARGAYVRPLGDTVYLAPALTITPADFSSLLEIFVDAVRAVCQP